MAAILTTSASVWLLIILICGTATASVFAAQAWQQARRPFVTFDQRSAENRMQNWLLLAAALLCVTLVTLGLLRGQRSVHVVEASAETPSPLTIAELVTATPTFQPTATPRPTALCRRHQCFASRLSRFVVSDYNARSYRTGPAH